MSDDGDQDEKESESKKTPKKGKKIGVRGGLHANRDQQLMREVWRTAAWAARVKELLTTHERCEWCNGKSSVVNHIRQGFYEGYALCRREEVDIICQPCHLEWTKTGLKRSRLYDDCAECSAPIYIGRKGCFSCGSKEILSKGYFSPEQKASFEIILQRCPEVRIDDVWDEIWSWDGPVTVKGFEKQDLPWPLVKTDRGAVGLPAFTFGKLVSQGSGGSSGDQIP